MENLFADPTALEKIRLTLTDRSEKISLNYLLSWDDIFDGILMHYEIEYADNNMFTWSRIFDVYGNTKLFTEWDLGVYTTYFFRVRAVYGVKHTPWSSTLAIANKSNYLRFFTMKYKKYEKKISFYDLLSRVNKILTRKANQLNQK